MCFEICTINIRVSIRVRGLHLVFPMIKTPTTKVFEILTVLVVTTLEIMDPPTATIY